MTNEQHAVATLMTIFDALCDWEHDYSKEADAEFVSVVDRLLIKFREERPDLEEQMLAIDYAATDRAHERWMGEKSKDKEQPE